MSSMSPGPTSRGRIFSTVAEPPADRGGPGWKALIGVGIGSVALSSVLALAISKNSVNAGNVDYKPEREGLKAGDFHYADGSIGNFAERAEYDTEGYSTRIDALAGYNEGDREFYLALAKAFSLDVDEKAGLATLREDVAKGVGEYIFWNKFADVNHTHEVETLSEARVHELIKADASASTVDAGGNMDLKRFNTLMYRTFPNELTRISRTAEGLKSEVDGRLDKVEQRMSYVEGRTNGTSVRLPAGGSANKTGSPIVDFSNTEPAPSKKK